MRILTDPWAIPLNWFDAAEDGGAGGTAAEAGDGAGGEPQGSSTDTPPSDQGGQSTEDPGQTETLNADKGADPGWLKLFPKEQQNDEFFKQYPNAKEALLDLKSKVERSKNAIIKPGEGATEGEIAEYRRSLGIPEKPEDYHLPLPEGLPEGLTPGEDTWFRELAHKHGLSKQQAENVFQDYYRNVGEQYKAQQAERERQSKQAVADLQREYGAEYNAKLTLGQRAIQEIGGADFAKYLEESGLGNDPRMIRAAIRMGELIGEDSLVAGRVSTPLAGERRRDPGSINLDYGDYFQ